MSATKTKPADLAGLLPPGIVQYATIHRSSGPIADALAALPAWVEARDRLLALPPVTASTSGTADAEAAVVALVSEAVAAGDDLGSPALAKRAAQVYAEVNGRHLVGRATEQYRKRAANDLDSAVAGHMPKLMGYLADQLAPMLTEAATLLDRLGGATDVESAVDAGLLVEFRRLRDLAQEYAALRDAQGRLFLVTENRGRKLSSFACAYLAVPEAVDPHLIPRMRGLLVMYDDVARPAMPPPGPDLTGPEGLAWCVQHSDGKPWVPTPTELEQAEERLYGRVMSAPTVRIQAGRPPVWAGPIREEVTA